MSGKDQGVSADADRATAVEPVPVSPLRDGIADAEIQRIANGGAWQVATVLSIAEAAVVRRAMYARWLSQTDIQPPMEVNDAGWGDLWAAGFLALEKYREQTP